MYFFTYDISILFTVTVMELIYIKCSSSKVNTLQILLQLITQAPRRKVVVASHLNVQYDDN